MAHSIVPTLPSHIALLADRLRAGDAAEIEAAGITPRRALWRSWKRSVFARTAFVDGEIACVWGCAGAPLGPVGEPWLLTAPAIERAKIAFVREARAQVAEWTAVWPRLEGRVLASYARATRLLHFLGFTLEPPRAEGASNALFCTYWLGAR